MGDPAVRLAVDGKQGLLVDRKTEGSMKPSVKRRNLQRRFARGLAGAALGAAMALALPAAAVAASVEVDEGDSVTVTLSMTKVPLAGDYYYYTYERTMRC